MSTCRWADIISSDSGYSFGRIARLENGTKTRLNDDSTFDPNAYEITEVRSINGHVSKLNIKKSPVRCSFKGILTELSQSNVNNNSTIGSKSVTPHTSLTNANNVESSTKLVKKDHKSDHLSDVYYSQNTKEPLNPAKKRKDVAHKVPVGTVKNDVVKDHLVKNGSKTHVKNDTLKDCIVKDDSKTHVKDCTVKDSVGNVNGTTKWNVLPISDTSKPTSVWPSLTRGGKNDKRKLDKCGTINTNGNTSTVKSSSPIVLNCIDGQSSVSNVSDGVTDMDHLFDLLSSGDLDKLVSLPTAFIERLTKSLTNDDVNKLNDYQRHQLLQKTALMQQILMQQISEDTALPNTPQVETNIERVNARLKDIAVGKMTKEYKNYISRVPRHDRSEDDPQTPDPTEKCSSAKFRSKYRIWRVGLHKYD